MSVCSAVDRSPAGDSIATARSFMAVRVDCGVMTSTADGDVGVLRIEHYGQVTFEMNRRKIGALPYSYVRDLKE